MDDNLDEKIDELHRVHSQLLGQKPKHKNNIVKILSITFAAILIVSVLTNLYGPEYTGHIIKNVDYVDLEELAYKESRFEFSSNKDIDMTSAKISGTILGDGSVSVFLKTPSGNKLVYTNEDLPKDVPLITGFAVHEGPRLIVNIDDVVFEDNSLKNIGLTDSGNTLGMSFEKVKISWDGDEKVIGMKVDGQDFWGYNRVGNNPTPKSAGSFLEGWGVKLPEGELKNIDEIRFDNDMGDKKITLEIYYQNFLVGFRLGAERIVKIEFDLSGNTNSVIYEDGEEQESYALFKSGFGEDIIPTGPDVSEPQIVPVIPDFEEISTDDNVVIIQESESERYPDYNVNIISAEIISKEKSLEVDKVNFVDEVEIDIKITEDIRFRKIFEDSELTSINEIASECEQTCVLDNLKGTEYEFIFEIEEGTAFNVQSIDFS